MSSAIKYYNSHKEQVLKYKKEYYQNKTKKYSFFKNIKIKGYTKRQTNNFIKTAIDNDKLNIMFYYGDEYKKYTYDEFIELYTFQDFSIIELQGYVKYYTKSQYLFFCEKCDDMRIENIMHYLTLEKKPLEYIEFTIEVFENQIYKKLN